MKEPLASSNVRAAIRAAISIAIAAGFAIALGQPGWAEAQITEADVASAVASPTFQQQMGTCLAGSGVQEVSLSVVVGFNGTCTLTGLEPAFDSATTACIAGAVAYMPFPATGSSFQVSFSTPVPQILVLVPAPVSVAPAVQPAVVEAQPTYPQQLYPQQLAPVRPPKPQLSGESLELYRHGRSKMVGGIVATGLGGLGALIGLLFLTTSPGMCDSMSGYGYYDPGPCRAWIITGGVFLATGVLLLTLGGVNITKGKRMKASAIASSPVAFVTPTPITGGGSLTLTLLF